MNNITIFWFRRDLRLHDNVGLYHALQEQRNVLPIFIFDAEILDKLPKDDARVNFIHDQLSAMNEKLQSHGSGISIFHGKPIDIYRSLLEQHNITAVYTNRDYEPYATSRDQEISELLEANNIEFKTFKDQVIFEMDEVTKADGNPYVVYTPYSRKWLEHYSVPDLLPSERFVRSMCKK